MFRVYDTFQEANNEGLDVQDCLHLSCLQIPKAGFLTSRTILISDFQPVQWRDFIINIRHIPGKDENNVDPDELASFESTPFLNEGIEFEKVT